MPGTMVGIRNRWTALRDHVVQWMRQRLIDDYDTRKEIIWQKGIQKEHRGRTVKFILCGIGRPHEEGYT